MSMKLLIITQKVDKNDPILGFFHGWLKEFSKNVEKLTVICLGAGEHDLPQNVQVFSLGKPTQGWPASGRERLFCKLKALAIFYKYIFKLRKEYDTVFVHMNKEYVILGGLFWKLWNKKIALWYNHSFGDFMVKISVFLSDNVFYTSPQAFTSKHKKSKQMSAGIDTNLFKKIENIEKKKNSLLFLGRISPIKNLDLLIDSVISINKFGNDLKLDIFGGPANPGDYSYADELKKRTKEQNKFIIFNGPVANYKTPQIFNEHEVFVNLTPSGSLDKTTLEAMSCETLVLTSNRYFEDVLENDLKKIILFKEKNRDDLIIKIKQIFKLKNDEKKKISKELRKIVIQKHSLSFLVKNVIETLSK